MKKINLTFIATYIFTISLFAQAPEKINYQGVARDNSGNILANQTLGLQLSIHSGTPTGTVVYTEMQTPSTNQFGLFNIEFGGGAGFNTIDWNGNSYYLQVEMDASGGSSYQDMGTSQLLSVPYALNAKTSSDNKWLQTGNTISNINIGNVGIGTIAPSENLAVQNGLAIDQSSTNNGTVTNTLKLGGGSGEAIGSKRTAGGNQYGIDLYTANTARLSVSNSGNIGIGTTFPLSKLQVKEGAVLFDGIFYEPGTTSGVTPTSGEGSRLMWIPATAAFRAGVISSACSTCWDETEIGVGSFAAGVNTKASGPSSTAFGDNTTASGYNSTVTGTHSIAAGDFSTAMGNYANATGESSTAIGVSSTANADFSVAIGFSARADGDRSIALGKGSDADGHQSIAIGHYVNPRSYLETALGSYSTDYFTGTNGLSQWNPTDRLFIIGNGENNSTRSDALTILKNGNLKFGNKGTYQTNIQTGQTSAGSSSGNNFKTYTFNFPNTFTATPKITVTAANETAVDDVFVITVRSVSISQCTVNIFRANASTGLGWGQNLKLNWVAWE